MDQESNIQKDKDIQVLVKIEGVELKGFNLVRTQIQKKYGNIPIFINLLKYSKAVIQNFIKNNDLITTNNIQQRALRQLSFNSDGTLRHGHYLVKDDDKFEYILNSRALYGYKAIVYKLKSLLRPWENKVYFGFSKNDVITRLGKHIMAAIGPHGYCPECEYVNLVKLHKAIINTLEYERIDINKEYQFLKLKTGTLEYENRMNILIDILKKNFEIDTLEIHKEIHTACQSERWFTKNYVNDDGSIGTIVNGLNETKGGSDGHYIDLPLIDIGAMFSIGVKPKRIHRLIKRLYLIDVSYETLSERIRDVWESYGDALELFLKPVVEVLIKHNLDFKFGEICKAINRDRSNVRIYLKKWYKERTFSTLKNLKKRDILDWSNLQFYTEEERPELRGIPLKSWKNWLVEGVSCKKIGDRLGLSEETIRQAYKGTPELGLPHKCRERLRRKKAKELLAKDWDPKDIMINIFKMKPKDNYGVRTFYERLFKGMVFENIVEKGRKGVL